MKNSIRGIKHITAAIFTGLILGIIYPDCFWQTVSNQFLPSQALSEAFTQIPRT